MFLFSWLQMLRKCIMMIQKDLLYLPEMTSQIIENYSVTIQIHLVQNFKTYLFCLIRPNMNWNFLYRKYKMTTEMIFSLLLNDTTYEININLRNMLGWILLQLPIVHFVLDKSITVVYMHVNLFKSTLFQ